MAADAGWESKDPYGQKIDPITMAVGYADPA
jgi:hypothetical protein